MFRLLSAVSALALAGCAQSSVLPLDADTVQITTSAAPVCGTIGAQKVALRRAAIETINRGYDRFVIVQAGGQNNVRVVGHTPVQAHTYGTAQATGYGTAYGSATTYYTGGQPIIGGSHDQGLVVRMFKAGDPAGARAISARETLGEKWRETIKESANTTC